jgi:uncharacterized protein (TIGR03435 family)
MPTRVALRVVIATLFLVIFFPPCRALDDKQQPGRLPLEFEIASVRPVKNTTITSWRLGYDGDTFRARNETISQLVEYAYKKQDSEIIWGNVRAPKELFTITAKISTELAEQLKQMSNEERGDARRKIVQNLLETRFKLIAHEELRERPAYILTAGKASSKLTRVTAEDSVIDKENLWKNKPLSSLRSYGDIQDWHAEAFPFLFLPRYLSQELRIPVIDRSNISGKVSFHLRWTSETHGLADTMMPADMRLAANEQNKTSGEDLPSDLTEYPAPPLPVALKEQLGLVLTRQRINLPVLVIDHVESPTDN